jgi:hypothetical protein
MGKKPHSSAVDKFNLLHILHCYIVVEYIAPKCHGSDPDLVRHVGQGLFFNTTH